MLSIKDNSNTGIYILWRRYAIRTESRRERTGKVAEKKAGNKGGPKEGGKNKKAKKKVWFKVLKCDVRKET